MPRNHRIAKIPEHKCEWCGKVFRRYINANYGRPRYCRQRCANDAKIGKERSKQPLSERFWFKVNKTTTCWVWIAGTDSNGYGLVRVAGKNRGAHVVSWEMHNGPITNRLHVLHRCDNPPCVNPAHLFLGTHQDNMADMVNKGRAVGNGRTILGEIAVREIRNRYAQGGVSYETLGRDFGVGASAVNHIVHRRTWAHID